MVSLKTAIIVYHTYGGNTEEVAEIIGSVLEAGEYSVDLYRIGSGVQPDLFSYSLCFLGTFTWDKGTLPEEMEEFIELNDLPSNKAFFGTGDTQFGGDALFCKAIDILVRKCGTSYIPLKIEQTPRGAQESKVENWTQQIISINKKRKEDVID